MAPLKCKVACAVVFVVVISGQVRCNNIIIDESCPRTGQGCLQCLSRNSEDIERCQQLLFYITYTTGNNQAQVESYCSGQCPITLATANFYCGSPFDIPELFAECPSYSISPSGSFSVNVKYNNSEQSCLSSTTTNCLECIEERTLVSEVNKSTVIECPSYSVSPSGSFGINVNNSEQACLGSTTRDCLECIGERTPEAVRCLQAYLLAQYSNSSAPYSSDYCSSNCPLVLNSFTWYCGNSNSSIIRDAYEFCQRTDTAFCGDLLRSSGPEIFSAATSCFNDCTSDACNLGINQFGCCLRRQLGNHCHNIPNCTLETNGNTQNIVINRNCPFEAHGCSQCLSRNSDNLERCEQLYTYITTTTSNDVERREFCSGECPILLITSDFFCTSSSRSTSDVLEKCHSYNVLPSTSVEITANFSGQNCLDSGGEVCLECITSRSPEPTRCLQLFLLAQVATPSETYIKEFCTGNCPLTLGTTTWYCSISARAIFNFCNRTHSGQSGQYCRAITRNLTTFGLATGSCRANCNSTECAAAQREYGCCLTSDGVVNARCSIPTCSVETAAGAPPLLASASLITTVLSVLIYSLFN